MSGLLGLSPEEINHIANQRISTQQLAHQALGAGADWALTQEKIRSSNDLVDMDFNGKIYKIRRQDVPEAAKIGAMLPSEIAKNQAQTGQANATAFNQYQSGRETQTMLPHKINYNQALTDDANTRAAQNRSQVDIAQQKLPGELEKLTAERMNLTASAGRAHAAAGKDYQDVREGIRKEEAIKALTGVPLDDMTKPENFSNLVQASPGVAAGIAQWHRPNPAEERRLAHFQMNLVKEIDSGNYKPEYLTEHNNNAIILNKDTFMYLHQPAERAWQSDKAIRVQLPVVNGKQMYPKDVAQLAEERGVSLQQIIQMLKIRQETAE